MRGPHRLHVLIRFRFSWRSLWPRSQCLKLRVVAHDLAKSKPMTSAINAGKDVAIVDTPDFAMEVTTCEPQLELKMEDMATLEAEASMAVADGAEDDDNGDDDRSKKEVEVLRFVK